MHDYDDEVSNCEMHSPWIRGLTITDLHVSFYQKFTSFVLLSYDVIIQDSSSSFPPTPYYENKNL